MKNETKTKKNLISSIPQILERKKMKKMKTIK